MSGRWRIVVFAGVCAIALAAILPSVLGRGHHARPTGQADYRVLPVPAQGVTGDSYLLVRSTSLDRDYGRIGLVPDHDPNSERMLSPLSCDRADFQGGLGLCLTRASGLFGATRAVVFDPHFRPLRTVDLTGYPSRVQVSPDGHLGATTVFVSGDSYATAGQFSTRSDIIDLRTGQILLRLEDLTVTKGGQPFQDVNFNFWGVTFAPDDRTFYATLGTGTTTYLIKGDVGSHSAVVLRSGVECPSLSPDGTRLAFKSRNPGTVITWRLSVLDLATLRSHPLAETRDVDDQAAWLDNQTVIYGLVSNASDETQQNASQGGLPALTTGGSIATDTWAVPADGTGHPRRLVRGAWSTVPTQG